MRTVATVVVAAAMVGRSRAVLLKYLWICNVLYEVKQEPDHES